jgi:hypothetical protein
VGGVCSTQLLERIVRLAITSAALSGLRPWWGLSLLAPGHLEGGLEACRVTEGESFLMFDTANVLWRRGEVVEERRFL